MNNNDRTYGGMMAGPSGGREPEDTLTAISIVAPAAFFTYTRSVARERGMEQQQLISEWIKNLIIQLRKEDLKAVPQPQGVRRTAKILKSVDDALERETESQELKLGTRVTKIALVYEAMLRGLQAAGKL